jgi:uncharacterized membrane protein
MWLKVVLRIVALLLVLVGAAMLLAPDLRQPAIRAVHLILGVLTVLLMLALTLRLPTPAQDQRAQLRWLGVVAGGIALLIGLLILVRATAPEGVRWVHALIGLGAIVLLEMGLGRRIQAR